jgi:predicted aconitase
VRHQLDATHAALDAGLPHSAASFLQGDDRDALAASAAALKALAASLAPSVTPDAEEETASEAPDPRVFPQPVRSNARNAEAAPVGPSPADVARAARSHGVTVGGR